MALLQGRKTQTRRIVKPPAPFVSEDTGVDILWATNQVKCPYGLQGDRLWVRETWRIKEDSEGKIVEYRAGGSMNLNDSIYNLSGKFILLGWHSSIHQPRFCSRILLDIINIRVERLQDISEEDVIAEGIESAEFDDGIFYQNYSPIEVWQKDPVFSYRTLWESINGAGSWNLNPWVWVVEFKRL